MKTEWRAIIGYQKQNRHLGYFNTKEAAANAYEIAFKELYGEA